MSRSALPSALLVCLLSWSAAGCRRDPAPAPHAAPPAKTAEGLGPEPAAADHDFQPPGAPAQTPGRRPIHIDLPSGPPAGDAVTPGTYVLSSHVELEGGEVLDNRHACTLEVDGETLTIRLDRSAQEPLRGTLKDGRLAVPAPPGPASYGMEGQVIGPGKLAGRLVGADAASTPLMRDGRWLLERVK